MEPAGRGALYPALGEDLLDALAPAGLGRRERNSFNSFF
jgi:hypothetical protein